MKVYAVIFDWSTEDGCDLDLYLYDTHKKAYTHYLELIASEKDPELSWAGNAIHQDGSVDNNYYFTERKYKVDGENAYLWSVSMKENWEFHDVIELKIMEVK